MVAAAMGQAKVLGLIVHRTSAAIMRANQLRLWFTAMTYVLFAALGGWMGGFIFDISGSYAYAFLAAFGFNVVNFCTIAIIHLRQIRLGLSPLPA